MLKITCLGMPQLQLGEQQMSERLSGKPLALFCYLAVTRRQHSRDLLADLLWSELNNQQARNNLRYTLSDLRQVMADYLLITPQTIGFNRQSSYWLDVEVLQTTLATKPTEVSSQTLQAVLDLYQEEFLAGFSVRNAPVFEEWVVRQREELHTQALQGLYTLAEHYYQQGEYQAGLATTQRLLHWEPWHEAGHRQQMHLLAASGQRSAALAQYILCRNMLANELGVEPEEATTTLYEQIRSGAYDKKARRQDDGSTEFAEVKVNDSSSHPIALSSPHPAIQSPHHNLPGQLTPFIGREAEIDQLCTLLASPNHRLITLTGLGGMGKTRLALAAGQRILDLGFEVLDLEPASPSTNQNPKSKIQNPKFPDGVWFVPLIGVAAGENLMERLAVAVMDALQLPRSGPLAAVEQLLDVLQNQRLLLILDNFEHLPDGAEFLLTLLQRTTAVKLLVTSRRTLNLEDEFVWQLDGLATPGLEEGVTMKPGAAQRYDSVALFVERAQRTDRTFRLDQTNQTEVLHICRFVAGLPLGIELAAAMIRYSSCRQLWQTLQQDYRALAVTQRDLAPRHRSLTAVFDYSWRLLTPAQARILAACTLFPQAFTAEAAAAVADATKEILFALVDHSLLKETAIGRFELHELVRQYAAGQLEPDPQEVAQSRQRHADYYSNLIETDTEELMRTPAKLQLVQQELPNLRMAWFWSIEQQQLLPIMRLSEGIFLHFMARGPLQEGWNLCSLAVEGLRRWPTAPKNMAAEHFLALAPVGLAYLGYYMGRYAEVLQLAEEAIALAQPISDARTLAMAYSIKGMVAFAQGELEEHERHCRVGLAYARSGSIQYMIVVNLAFLGLGLTVQGKLNEARTALLEALQLIHEQHFVYLEGYVLSELGFVYAMTGDWALADETTQQALQLGQGLNNSLNRGYQYARLALFAEAVGDYPRAITWTDQALAFSAISPDPSNQLTVLLVRGRTMRQLGDLKDAATTLQQLLSLAQRLGRQAECAQAHIELGHIAVERQTWQTAEAHYRAALEIATVANLPCQAAAQAGLAQICFQQKNLAAALSWAESSWDILRTQALEPQYDAAATALACYQMLDAVYDPRASVILQWACTWVEEQSLKISDETLRRSFLENVPHHRQLLALARL